MPNPHFTRDQISAALNISMDEIINAAGLGEEAAANAMILLLNATLHMLDHNPAGDTVELEQVVADIYEDGTTLTDVLGWLR
ncbi:hypothetical protein MUG78_17780 [Gordonia alkaliphila]|uniref:hypothetical protein n=1 Tax=Gordonia alkaliphila TaxID=1053547 RepID=UPI001FF5AD04|nr:hypothetical protein [Gordonia alkaliphila]MCK0441252.1 hypothetical protein [Gordonia alkaliphila]